MLREAIDYLASLDDDDYYYNYATNSRLAAATNTARRAIEITLPTAGPVYVPPTAADKKQFAKSLLPDLPVPIRKLSPGGRLYQISKVIAERLIDKDPLDIISE